ncbi:MAG: trypsin-like peptidase domain-containing protein [Clostridiaceae bacterium]|nr:trypsin-like peptidase domain-containing protein [Clostridiaceae bacterium]
MSNLDSDNKYSYSFTPADEEAQARQNASFEEQRRAAEDEHKRELRGLRRSMTKMIAIFCAITLVLGIGGGALVGNFVAQNAAQTTSLSTIGTQTATPDSTAATTAAPSATTATPGSTTSSGLNGAVGSNLYATTSGGSASMSSADVYALVSNSVVSILTEYPTSTGYYQQSSTASGAGSGVIISADGYIVTNNHVIESASKITVALADNTEYEATLVGTDDVTDVALLKIDAQNLSYTVIGDSSALRIGDPANVIGNPLGKLSGTLTVGVISGLDREITMSDGTTMNLIQMDASVNPGNSGGGVFNSAGELVGITVAKTSATEVEGIGYAIPINDVLPILDELMAHGYVTGRPALGISVIEITDQFTAMMYRVNYLGVYITAVVTENGLQVGDYIVSVDGAEVSSTADINAALQNHVAGDTIDVVVYRGSGETTVSVTLVEEGSLQ